MTKSNTGSLWFGIALGHALSIAALAETPLVDAVTNPLNCRTYLPTPKGSWQAAQNYATTLGGNLATVRSSADQQWIMSTFVAGANVRRILWIGLSDGVSEGNFQWASGEQSSFRNWGVGEPNDYKGCVGTGEDWVALNWEFGNGNNSAPPGAWNDTPIAGLGFGCTTVPFAGLVEIAQPLIVFPQPQSQSICVTNNAIFVAGGAGTGPFDFHWEYEQTPGSWVAMPEGVFVNSGIAWSASGVLSSQLQLERVAPTGVGSIRLRCVIANSCGSVTSEPAALIPCQSDLTCDNVVDDEDFVVFAAAYDILDCADPAMAAGCQADLNGDGLVDDADFVLFVAAYNNLGCL